MSMSVRQIHAIVVMVLLLAFAPACTSVPAETIPSASVVKTEPAENELIRGYQQWTRVNPKPVVMEPRAAAACAIAFPSRGPSPHADKFITVYVNETGTKAMMQQKTPRFPRGSIIVKEKLSDPNSSSPELLTVMIKRDKGFNPENGDWEYLVLDGAGKEVQARGKLENCQACHTTVRPSDYVYRSYLTPDVWKKLK